MDTYTQSNAMYFATCTQLQKHTSEYEYILTHQTIPDREGIKVSFYRTYKFHKGSLKNSFRKFFA